MKLRNQAMTYTNLNYNLKYKALYCLLAYAFFSAPLLLYLHIKKTNNYNEAMLLTQKKMLLEKKHGAQKRAITAATYKPLNSINDIIKFAADLHIQVKSISSDKKNRLRFKLNGRFIQVDHLLKKLYDNHISLNINTLIMHTNTNPKLTINVIGDFHDN